MFELLRNRNNGLIHEIATTIEVSRLNINLWIKGLGGIQAAYPDDKKVKSKNTDNYFNIDRCFEQKSIMGLIIYFELCQIILLLFKVYIKHGFGVLNYRLYNYTILL